MVKADEELFQWINGFVGRWELLDRAMKLLASDFLMPVAIAVAAFSMWFAGRSSEERLRNQMGFLYAIIGAAFANLFVRALANHVDRARPFAALDDVEVLFYAPSDPTVPSNGAAFVFAMAAGVWLTNRRMGVALGVGALLFSFSRVYVGMHYPFDVVAGAAFGALTTYFVARLLDLLRPVLDWAMGLLRRVYLI